MSTRVLAVGSWASVFIISLIMIMPRRTEDAGNGD
jgi:hypothetical protein